MRPGRDAAGFLQCVTSSKEVSRLCPARLDVIHAVGGSTGSCMGSGRVREALRIYADDVMPNLDRQQKKSGDAEALRAVVCEAVGGSAASLRGTRPPTAIDR